MSVFRNKSEILLLEPCDGKLSRTVLRGEAPARAPTYPPLNIVKCTEWNKNEDGWIYEKPWSWENYYIWEDNNLVSIEDYAGHNQPTYIYNYSYYSIAGVQNVVPLHFGRYQYYPLQLKGYFGSTPENLIEAVESIVPNMPTINRHYEYEIDKNKITGYSETRNGASEHYSVGWTE